MCDRCKTQLLTEVDILDTDLPHMSFELLRWTCIVSGCNKGTFVRDYGLAPYYHHPVKLFRTGTGRWRGGWFRADCHHWLCGACWKKIRTRQIALPEHSDPDILITHIVPVKK